MAVHTVAGAPLQQLVQREWIVTNRLGGYASSTVPGLNTRKYHGLLVAAMSPPVRRMVLLSRVEETITHRGVPAALGCCEYPGTISPRGHELLQAFAAAPFPRWAYQGDGWTLEKQLVLLPGQNTVVLSYSLLGAREPVRLQLRPMLALRPMHELMYQWNAGIAVHARPGYCWRVSPTARTPELFIAAEADFEPSELWYFNNILREEHRRGYAGLEDLWSPGVMSWTLAPGQTVCFACSTEPLILQSVAERARDVKRAAPQPSAQAAPMPGDSLKDAIEIMSEACASYLVEVGGGGRSTPRVSLLTRLPWSAPSWRDALIAAPGALMCTGRLEQAGALLAHAASQLRGGLLPGRMDEAGAGPIHDSADASLWFIHAAWEYARRGGDEQALRGTLAPACMEIVLAYQRGTELGVHVGLDSLLQASRPGLGLTWMDSRIGDYVVTPRAGRPVELNALWHHALRSVAEFCRRFGPAHLAGEFDRAADGVRDAFNRAFWSEAARSCHDVVGNHGVDAAMRPNQLFAVGLPHPVLAPEHHAVVVESARQRLLTSAGLRTLDPSDPNYHGRCGEDIVTRERAAHQGCAHPWLIAIYCDAVACCAPGAPAATREIRAAVDPLLAHVLSRGDGHLCELFDGDAPHHPGGAPFDLRNTAELLRVCVDHLKPMIPAPDESLSPQLQPR